MTSVRPYDGLDGQVVLQALESVGLWPDGRMIALNSYENRVYLVHLEDGSAVVVKFYRPERWTEAQVLEEHALVAELAAADVPVAAPLSLAGVEGQSQLIAPTLAQFAGYRFAVYPRARGRAPEFNDLEQLEQFGVALARLHQVGARSAFQARLHVNVQRWGWDAREQVLHTPLLPQDQGARYAEASRVLIEAIAVQLESTKVDSIRLHGDCHASNILWDDGPSFVDFDDAVQGPAVQDFWMLLHGDRRERTLQLDALLAGYETVRPFDARELRLIEPLRGLRQLQHAAWLSSRWSDPAFPAAFPWCAQPDWWHEHIAGLERQRAALDEAPLALGW